MPRVTIPASMFAVSFNATIGNYEFGESDMFSINYIGDDVDALIAEVLASDPSFPMRYVAATAEDVELGIVGKFIDASEEDDEYPTAVLFERAKFSV